MRMASRNDFLSQQAPMRERCPRVAVIMQAIAGTAFFTVQSSAGITHQPNLGRRSADFDCFRMHGSDRSTGARGKGLPNREPTGPGFAATVFMLVKRSRTVLKSLSNSSAIFCACISSRRASSLRRVSLARRTSPVRTCPSLEPINPTSTRATGCSKSSCKDLLSHRAR